jgi:2-hydroxychromene-2-carboxylate isomerase
MMGELIVLAERLADRSRAVRNGRPAFFFDLACPFSYLAAERVERELGEVDWIPAAAVSLHGEQAGVLSPPVRRTAELRAAQLRLPLVWPERLRASVPTALRAAAYAAELGAGAAFALAASRLAFCGGFDLEDPETLAEAAAAAGIPLVDCIFAAGDPTRDGTLHATARGLAGRGVRSLPVVSVGHRWFEGEQAIGEASALMAALDFGPLAPAG